MNISEPLLNIYNLGHPLDSPDFDWWAWHSKQPILRSWHRWIGNRVIKMVGNSESVLCIGCGSSYTLTLFKGRVVGIDLNEDKLKFLKSRCPRIETICADITKLDPIGKFDCVVCSAIFEHLTPEDLKEAIRFTAVSAKGKVVVSAPNYESRIGRFVENTLHGHVHYDTRFKEIDRLFSVYGFSRARTEVLFWDTVVEYRR